MPSPRSPHGAIAAGPRPAERARTVLQAAPVLEVLAPAAHGLVPDHGTDRHGRPLLIVDDGSALAGLVAAARGPVEVSLHAARLSPLRVPDRLRGRVEIRGLLDVVPPAERPLALLQPDRQGRAPAACALPEGSSLLRIEPVTISVDGVGVDPVDHRCAAPDPLVDAEPALLQTLLAARPRDLAGLCTMLDPMLLVDVVEIAPSGLDRYGLTLRVAGRDHVREARLPFVAPVDGPRDVPVALQVLLGRARSALPPLL